MTLPAFRDLPAETRVAQRALLTARMGRRARHRQAFAAAVVLAALAAAPTFAFHREVVDFFSGEEAPDRIQLDFESLRAHVAEASSKFGAPKFTPLGPAREVMRVHIDGQVRSFWVVPTQEGTFCYRLHFGLSCLTPENADRVGPIGGGGLMSGSDGMDWIDGRVSDEAVQELELLYQDGERVKVPFVWVSPPIDEGFYAYDIPADREQPGRLAVALIGLDEDGKEVAHFCLGLSPDELARSVPAVATLCKRRS